MSRRDRVVAAVAAIDPTLGEVRIGTALDAAVTSDAALRILDEALSADPQVLRTGAPPVVGRLVAQLAVCGSVLALPACVRCGRTGRPLFRCDAGGVCASCRRWQLAVACSDCGPYQTPRVSHRDWRAGL